MKKNISFFIFLCFFIGCHENNNNTNFNLMYRSHNDNEDNKETRLREINDLRELRTSAISYYHIEEDFMKAYDIGLGGSYRIGHWGRSTGLSITGIEDLTLELEGSRNCQTIYGSKLNKLREGLQIKSAELFNVLEQDPAIRQEPDTFFLGGLDRGSFGHSDPKTYTYFNPIFDPEKPEEVLDEFMGSYFKETFNPEE